MYIAENLLTITKRPVEWEVNRNKISGFVLQNVNDSKNKRRFLWTKDFGRNPVAIASEN